MDQNLHHPEVYDFRQYDRIWQRVAPDLEPYSPAALTPDPTAYQAARSEVVAVPTTPVTPPAASAPPAAAPSGDVPSVRPETPALPVPVGGGGAASLPGANRNPCCMGSAAMDMVDVVAGYMEAALSDRRYLLALARQAPSWARQTLRDIAADLQGQAGQLAAAYYLITGQRYRLSVSTERIYVGRWCPALRERYHAAACSGFNYQRSADDTVDPCLKKLFEDLSEESYGHAEEIMGLLQRQLKN